MPLLWDYGGEFLEFFHHPLRLNRTFSDVAIRTIPLEGEAGCRLFYWVNLAVTLRWKSSLGGC